jgi:hypothetical protein
MTRKAVASLSALILLAQPVAASTSYDERVVAVQRVGRRFPGTASWAGEYGLLAGILAQTMWQRDSGRSSIPLWSLVNESLTLEPTGYADAFEAAPAATPADVCVSFAAADACIAWVGYFQANDRVPWATPYLQSLLWRAHTTSIVRTLVDHRSELEQSGSAMPIEMNYWAGLIELVFGLERLNAPSTAEAVGVTRAIEPYCSPVGSADCPLSADVLGPAAYLFVAQLASRSASIDRLLSLQRPGYS